jgi:hypothetical protein
VNRSAAPFLAIGGAGILAGGLVSAASAASPSYLASWTVAYLVLVVGFAQVLLGIGQAQLAARRPPAALVLAEVLAFNLANVAVVAGSLASLVVLTWVGALLIVVAMALFIWAARGGPTGNRGLLWLYRAMIVLLLVSAPIGIILAHSRIS